MRKVLLAFAAFTLTGCQTDNNSQTSLASAEDSSEETFQEVTSPARTLAGGRYLVSVEMTGSCLDRVSNIKQTYEYPNSHPQKTPTITLEADGDETDNLARPAVCRFPAKDVGTTIVTVDKLAKVRAKGFAAKITKIEKIERTSTVPMRHLGDLFAAGYVLTVEKPGICQPGQFTSKKHTNYADDMSRTLYLSAGSQVGDNLIRPMICMDPEGGHRDAGTVYHEAPGGKLQIVGKDGVKVLKIERITKKSSL